MANYNTQAVIQPDIPNELLPPQRLRLLQAHGIQTYPLSDNTTYLAAPDNLIIEGDVDLEQEDGSYQYTPSSLYDILQAIIDESQGKIPFITLSMAWTCTRMRPDGWGGMAAFIASDRVNVFDTSRFLFEQESQWRKDSGHGHSQL